MSAFPALSLSFEDILVLAILRALELANETMRESALVRRVSAEGLRLYTCNGSYNYLLTLRAVIAAASVRLHVWLVACWVHAFLGQADHAFADL
jgi:hypothetical protein